LEFSYPLRSRKEAGWRENEDELSWRLIIMHTKHRETGSTTSPVIDLKLT